MTTAILRRSRALAFPASLILLMVACSPGSQTPANAVADAGCQVSQQTFAGWLDGGAGPRVTPDSIHFPTNDPPPNCAFYTWSERMFLWLTSPPPPTYGSGGSTVFTSPVFFTVSPADGSGVRTMHRIVSGERSLIVSASTTRTGPHGFALMRDAKGTAYELAPMRFGPNKLPEVVGRDGKLVEVARALRAGGGHVALFDREQRPIALPPRPANGIAQAEQLTISGTVTVIDISGTVIEGGTIQADNSVVMAQNGSPIYYTVAVNDVYANLRTGRSDGGLSLTHFPSSASDMDDILAYTQDQRHGDLPDYDAMAVELKMAWVEAVNLPSGCHYITIQASIPVYSPQLSTQPAQATLTGHRTATLALISMHVVGSAIGQPAMIWATFEHVCNAPNAGYSYQADSGVQTGWPESGPWLLSSSDTPSPANIQRMTASFGPPQTITPTQGQTMGPSDLERMMPWGLPGTSDPAENARVIAVNSSVRTILGSSDIRSNYILTGTTWYRFGIGGIWPSNPSGTWFVTQYGSRKLANTAIETFQQGDLGCLDCHTNTNIATTGNQNFNPEGNLGFVSGLGLSRIYGQLQPLP
ncbi:MAG: hypothetical protein JSR60_11260 [Proteobacteria bacterium]|nr:hypothetical protein [Pseudomonadota bacterium]